MTLEETIAHHRWCADNCEGEVRDEHLQMVGWLEELVELRAENVKLKELCKDMWRDVPRTESCGWDADANCCTGSDECAGECGYWYRMRELGIEVKDA